MTNKDFTPLPLDPDLLERIQERRATIKREERLAEKQRLAEQEKMHYKIINMVEECIKSYVGQQWVQYINIPDLISLINEHGEELNNFYIMIQAQTIAPIMIKLYSQWDSEAQKISFLPYSINNKQHNTQITDHIFFVPLGATYQFDEEDNKYMPKYLMYFHDTDAWHNDIEMALIAASNAYEEFLQAGIQAAKKNAEFKHNMTEVSNE